MYEKCNPSHPDKIADRIAGAIVDLAYQKQDNPKIAVEVLIGHGDASIIIESSVDFTDEELDEITERIVGKPIMAFILQTPQDSILASNQQGIIRCGDNGIFKGVPTTEEQKKLSGIVRTIYEENPHDGKYIIDGNRVIACQSHAKTEDIAEELWFKWGIEDKEVNPLGDWEGGTDVDTGATNRKLGSDMGDAVTGGGLHGKDLSKADVSVNIYAHIKAQEEQKEIRLCCAIGDEMIDGKPYSEIVEIAREYVKKIGGFEKLAEWGLI